MKNIDAKRLQQMLADKAKEGNGVLLIDVRSEEEFKHGHIDVAINIPLHHLANALELSESAFKKKYGRELKNSILVFCCKSGGRSSYACMFAEKAGLKPCNLQGGMLAWKSIDTKIKIL